MAIAKAQNLAWHGTVGVHKKLLQDFHPVNQLFSDGIVFDVANEKRRLKGGLESLQTQDERMMVPRDDLFTTEVIIFYHTFK